MLMLLHCAIGDAFGAGFEYVREPEFRARCHDLRYVQHPRHKGLKPGMYTDDTQMSLAIAEHLVEGAEWTPLALAERFVNTFHRDPRDGYARGFQRFLEATKTGADFLVNIRPHSTKSGAAMRAAPLGWLKDPVEVLGRCEVQARLTHDTPDGIAAAQAVAMAAHYLLYHQDEVLWDVLPFLDKHVPGFDWGQDNRAYVGPEGVCIVRRALFHLCDNDSVEVLLPCICEAGGDTDTVAAIAMSLASVCCDYEDLSIPTTLYDGLENGPFGRDYLRELDFKLHQLQG